MPVPVPDPMPMPTPQPWNAEREITPELAQALIEEQFPELPARSVELSGTGWDNAAFIVDKAWVFRFPRREVAVDLIATEAAVLPSLAPHLPLPIPVPACVGVPSERFPWPFVGYRRIEGETADRALLDDGLRADAARPLAAFLRALHDRPADELAALGLSGDTMKRLDLDYRIDRLHENLRALEALGLVDDPGAWRWVIEDLPAGWTPGTGTVVHGDLYARHFLVDADGTPCGVIDWGDVHLGDAAVDLSLAHGFLPASAHADFRAGYGRIDEDTWKVARFRALHAAAATAPYAKDMGDRALLREMLLCLERLRDG